MRKKRTPIYIAIAVLKLESTAAPTIQYYGDSEMLSNTISSIPLDKEKKSEYIIDTVVDDTKLWYIDLDNIQKQVHSNNEVKHVPTHEEAVDNAVKIANEILYLTGLRISCFLKSR